MNKILKLNMALQSVCPIDGVSVGRWDDRATWRVDHKPEATDQQRTAAANVVATFDPDAPSPEETREAADRDELVADLADSNLVATLNMTDAQINSAINAAFSDPAQRTIIKRLARLAQHAARGMKLR